jgi:hypothetical protein
MKLWLLRPVDGLEDDDNPWMPWYDKAFVRAKTEADARELAHAAGGDENRGEFLNSKTSNTTEPWRNAAYSTCVELTAKGPAEVVMADVWSA